MLVHEVTLIEKEFFTKIINNETINDINNFRIQLVCKYHI